MRIQTNVMALNTHRFYTINNNAVAKNAEKLSSGYRVNRAADDAAGLAISEKMRAEIRGLSMASKNSQDGISMVQTAEGALQEVQSMLQRMKELAVQSASDSNEDTVDRAALQQEFLQLQNEIDDVAMTTTFNDMLLFSDGTAAAPDTRVNRLVSSSGPDVQVFFVDGDVSDLANVESKPSENPYVQGETMSGYTALKEDLATEMVPQAVKALTTAFDQTFAGLANSKIGVGLKLVNEPGSSYNATFGYTFTGPAENLESDMTVFYQLTVNLAKLEFEADGETLTASGRKALEATILHEMMHGLMNEALSAGMYGRDATTGAEQDRFPGWFIEGTAQAASGASDWIRPDNPGIMNGIDGSSTLEEIKAALNKENNLLTSGHNDSKYATGYLASMYLAHKASGSDTVDAATLASGLDNFMKSIADGKSLDEAIAQYTDYDNAAEFEAGFANDADVHQFVKELITAYGDTGAGALAPSTGGLTATDVLADDAITSAAQPGFGLNTSYEWVQNRYPAGYDIIEGGGSGGSSTAGDKGASVLSGPGKWIIQVGSRTGNELVINIGDMNTDVLGIATDDANISTQEDASKAIDQCRDALNDVSTMRANLGAIQNRLEHKITNLDNTVENVSAAESRIRDVDIAKEMTNFTKNQILSQAATAMLAQANALPQGVLSLLR